MHRPHRQDRKLLGCLVLLLACGVTSVAGQPGQPLVPRKHHSWGRLAPGAWKKVRVTRQSFDAGGKITETVTTELTTTLVAVDDRSVTLRIDRVDVSGEEPMKLASKMVTFGYSGETDGQGVAYSELGTATLTVDGVKIETQIRRVVLQSGDRKLTSTIHYSDKIAPYVLRRSTSVTGGDGESVISTSEMQTIALAMPRKVVGTVLPTAHTKTVQDSSRGQRTSLEQHCEAVPGRVVGESTKLVDPEGRLKSRSTLELLDYGPKPQAALRNPAGRGFSSRPVYRNGWSWGTTSQGGWYWYTWGSKSGSCWRWASR